MGWAQCCRVVADLRQRVWSGRTRFPAGTSRARSAGPDGQHSPEVVATSSDWGHNRGKTDAAGQHKIGLILSPSDPAVMVGAATAALFLLTHGPPAWIARLLGISPGAHRDIYATAHRYQIYLASQRGPRTPVARGGAAGLPCQMRTALHGNAAVCIYCASCPKFSPPCLSVNVSGSPSPAALTPR